MHDFWVDLKSIKKGICAMRLKNNARWGYRIMPKRFWLYFWTPIWHDGNGVYLSVGLYFIAIYRGY